MRYNNTVFREMLNLIRIIDVNRSIENYQGDWHGRKYKSWDNLLLLLMTHIVNANSFREVETALRVNKEKLYHLGTEAHKRSTIADGMKRIEYRIYRRLFYKTLERYQKLTRTVRKKFKFKNPLKLMDSTVINLGLSSIKWEKYGKAKGAIKLHYEYDLNRDIPEIISISEKEINDCKLGKKLCSKKPDSIYCFDRGYNDYEWYYSFSEAKAYFVTRLKVNADYKTVGQHSKITEKQEKEGLLYDLEIKMKGYIKGNPKSLRLIGYIDKATEIQYQFLTNNFELDAYSITQIYKARWQIEIFFKWIKQNLKIKSFLGTSKNAILSQIWCAMIYYLCISFVKYQSKYGKSLFYLHKILKHTLFERRSLFEVLSLNYFKFKPRQLSLFDSS